MLALGLYRQHQATTGGVAVDLHGTGTADAVLTAHMGSGQTQVVAQEIGQIDARFGMGCQVLAIDTQCDGATARRKGITHAVVLYERALAAGRARYILWPIAGDTSPGHSCHWKHRPGHIVQRPVQYLRGWPGCPAGRFLPLSYEGEMHLLRPE